MNASLNLPIYWFVGSAFRETLVRTESGYDMRQFFWIWWHEKRCVLLTSCCTFQNPRDPQNLRCAGGDDYYAKLQFPNSKMKRNLWFQKGEGGKWPEEENYSALSQNSHSRGERNSKRQKSKQNEQQRGKISEAQNWSVPTQPHLRWETVTFKKLIVLILL